MRARNLILALALTLLAPALPLRASPDMAALRDAWDKHASYFAEPALGGAGQLRVKATDAFLGARLPEKKAALAELAADWRRASPGDPLLMEVRWRYGGWIWRGKRDPKTGRERVSLVDRWDDGSFPWVQESSPWGKWFLFLGGQAVSGGDIGSSHGFNVRLGTTLFRDRYDAAFTFNSTSTGPAPKVKLTSLGALGRALFRVPDTHWGYNLGGGITVISGPGFDTENEFNVVGGLNLYQRGGSWDLSLNLGDEGTRTLVLGYSLFLNR